MDGAPADPVKEELAKVGSGVGRSGDATPADGPTSDPKAKADEDAGGDPKESKSADGADAKGDADPKETDAEKSTSGGGSGTHDGKAADAPAPMELDADAEVDRSCWPKSFRGCFRLRAVMTKLVPDDLDRTDAGTPT